MLSKGDAVVAAVSGGADSVAMLYALWALRDELGISLIVAHLNHGIRGRDADRDAEFVEHLAFRLGLPSVIEKVDMPHLQKEMRMGMEEAAREVRYEFLEQVVDNSMANRVAVAHTADDQAETVLLNIIRGAGPDGLAGMQPVREKIIRPLIEVFRKDVEAYLRENGIEWRSDATNFEMEHTRNRVRLQLIPLLEKEFNPRVRESLLTLSRLVRDESEVVREAARRVFDEAAGYIGPEVVVLDADRLRASPVAVERRCLRMAVEIVKGDLRDVDYAQIERIVEKLRRNEKFHLTLPSGRVYAKLAHCELRIFKRTQVPAVEVVREVVIPGRTEVLELDVLIETRFVASHTRPESSLQAVIDSTSLKGSLVVRTWRRGDRIVPLGMTGQKKLQDVFTDKKVPRGERRRVPVLADDEKVVWVVGAAVSESVKVTDETWAALWIECTSLP